MDFKDLAMNRFSARGFRDEPVPREMVEKLVAVAALAPSAHNNQPWRVLALDSGILKDRVAALYNRDWIKEAPVILVVIGNHDESWKRDDGKDHCDMDGGIFIDHLMLAATAEGLGSCCVSQFSAAQCAALLNLEPTMEVLALLPLGFPKARPDLSRHETKRLGVGKIMTWG